MSVSYSRTWRQETDAQPRAQPDPPEAQFFFWLSVVAGGLARTLERLCAHGSGLGLPS